jgi:hypothetical protein
VKQHPAKDTPKWVELFSVAHQCGALVGQPNRIVCPAGCPELDPGFLYNIGENWMGDRSLASSMASVWQFASTRGFMFLVNAQRADPAELQVLDTLLPR